VNGDMRRPEQGAGYLQLNKDTVYRLIRTKRLAAARIGRTDRIPRQDLEALIVASSTPAEVRQTLFKRVLQISRRNPDLDSDALLQTLEAADGLSGDLLVTLSVHALGSALDALAV
jgi:excisionase family DNA binding protein